MRLLLDTHALVWWLTDDASLGARSRALIGDPAHDVLVSVISLWELTIKKRTRKLDLDLDQIIEGASGEGFFHLDILAAHLRALAGLPTHHRDPFDHLLMAQAVAEDATLLSADRQLSAYPVRLIDCAR